MDIAGLRLQCVYLHGQIINAGGVGRLWFQKKCQCFKQLKNMKKAVLISNFVDRESERPLIGPSDFLVVLPHTAEDGNNNTVEKKTLRKSRAKSKRSIEKKMKADGTLNSSSDTVPSDSCLIVGLSSPGAESGSLKRSGKEPSSDNLPNKSRDKPEHFLEQKLEEDPRTNLFSKVSVDYSSPLPCSNSVTNASASMKRTLKRTSSCELPKMSRVKHGSSLEGNITVDGMTKPSTETAVADSLGDGVESSIPYSIAIKRQASLWQ